MLFYIFILLVSIVFILYHINRTRYWKNRNIYQETGTLWKYVFGNQSLSECYKDIYDKNDTVVGIYLGFQPVLIVKDLEDVNAVLAGDFQSFYSRGIPVSEQDVLANNLLMLSDYSKWKIIRQKLSPLFTSAKLKNMFYILDKSARDFVDVLERNEDLRNKPFHALSVYTTSSIGAAVFGIDTKLKNTMESPFIEMAQRIVQPSARLDLLFVFFNYFRTLIAKLNISFFQEHEEFFVGFVKRVLETRRNENGPNKRHDFIDLCVELQKQGAMHDPITNCTLEPTDELLAAQAFFFFLAGVDTSANTLHFVLLELSCHQNILTKVHEELDSIFESGIEELTYNDVEKLQYLDLVLSEAMRKYPNIGLIQRECTKTTVLPSSKVKIEKGVGVVIPVFGIHRDEKYFPNPEEFIPERFAPGNLSKLKKFSYLPFGEGNRICIGSRFARLQVKAVLAWILRRFTLVEQNYKPKKFEKSSFSIRDTEAKFQLILRRIK